MKNSTLLIRSLLVIVLVAGGAHLVTYASQNKPQTSNATYKNNTEFSSENRTINDETDFIIGKWIVKYNEEDFEGAIVYDIRKEGTKFNAYTYEYQDTKGHGEKAEQTKTLVLKSFDGYTGKGIYTINYEGEKYEVACDVNMIDDTTFKLSYTYYGYSDVETWKKLK